MPSRVRLYGLLSCPHCKEARHFLQQKGVEFQTIFVDLLTGEERSETMREVRRLNSECSFPTIVIGAKVIVGLKKEEIAKALAADI